MVPLKKVIHFLLLLFLLPALQGCVPSHQYALAALYEKLAGQPAGVIRRSNITSHISIAALEKKMAESLYDGEPERYGLVVMGDTGEMAPAVFPHLIHRAQYTCRVCHSELDFSMAAGTSDISCTDEFSSRYCGACHDGITAFSALAKPTKYCNRCHLDPGNESAMKSIVRKSAKLIVRLPLKKHGDGVDWQKSIDQELITPASSLLGEPPDAIFSDYLQVPLEWDTAAPRVKVVFSHQKHLRWLDCSSCHPDLFNIKKMATVSLNKPAILSGMFCGTCHLRVAFPLNNCGRCHPGVLDWSGK